MTEDWPEIRRLHKSEQMSIKAIVRKTGLARNTVRAALASDAPPKYRRAAAGSVVDAFESRIRVLLSEFPAMPATVIAERIGWEQSSSVLRAKVAELRPLYAPSDPADRTVYVAGEIVQCDLWFPGKVIPVDGEGASKRPGWVGGRSAADLPVLTMVAAFSGFLMALLLPTRKTGDLVAGMWQLLAGLGGVPKMLVWDNESGIGQHHRLTLGARGFAGTLGTRIYQTAARDPEAKGVIERANGFFETSFMPGREFESPVDYNAQLAAWLPRANSRMLRRTGEQPGVRVAADVAAMRAMPPVAPSVGTRERVRLGRDYYVRIAGNDYSVDPSVIGRFVDVHADLTSVRITCTAGMWEFINGAGRATRQSPTWPTSRPRQGCGPHSKNAPPPCAAPVEGPPRPGWESVRCPTTTRCSTSPQRRQRRRGSRRICRSCDDERDSHHRWAGPAQRGRVPGP